MRPARPPAQPPAFNAIVLAVIVLLAVGVGAWYFLLRGGGQDEFLHAHERFVAAERVAEDAIYDITRFPEIDEFDVTVRAELTRMKQQAAVFHRLAAESGDEEALLAERAATEADRVVSATGAYHYALVKSNKPLSQAAAAIVEMQAGTVELNRIADEWANRQ